MGTKFLIGAAIFIGSFGLGLGATYLVISKVGTESPMAPPPPVGSAELSWPVPDHNRSAATGLNIPPVEAVADSPKPSADLMQANPAPATSDAQAAPSTADKPIVEDAGKWWDHVVGRRCALALDEVGFASLSLREGTIRAGETATFEASFANNRRLTVFKAVEKPSVEVTALAFDENGQPSIAQVRDPRSGAAGVISLQVEGKQIRLVPESEE